MSELYASALHLDRHAIKALKMTDSYSLHRVVYSLFSDVRDEAQKCSDTPSGIVYADQGGDFYGRKVLIVSDRQPMPQIEGQYGHVISKAIAPSFLTHPRYHFKVQVNPVKKDKYTGQRVAIRSRAAIATWFMQRAIGSWGFDVDPHSLQIDAIEVLQFNDKAGHQITLGKAHIQGQLQVTDTQQFHHSFKNGIGKGRAFGCGLLQIVPVIDNPFA
jgi:CRISPR system Cascade subunit CasE